MYTLKFVGRVLVLLGPVLVLLRLRARGVSELNGWLKSFIINHTFIQITPVCVCVHVRVSLDTCLVRSWQYAILNIVINSLLKVYKMIKKYS